VVLLASQLKIHSIYIYVFRHKHKVKKNKIRLKGSLIGWLLCLITVGFNGQVTFTGRDQLVISQFFFLLIHLFNCFFFSILLLPIFITICTYPAVPLSLWFFHQAPDQVPAFFFFPFRLNLFVIEMCIVFIYTLLIFYLRM